MQLSAYPMPTTYASATFPAYYFDPPAGSNWALILGAWDGVPGSSLGTCILSGNYNVTGWRADCSAVTTEPPGASLDNAIAFLGDDIGPGYSYPFALTGISNPDLTIGIMPLSDGSVAGLAASGKNMSTISMLALAAISAGAGAIVGAAVAGAGAATAAGSGATAMSSSDVSAIYGSAGYGDAAATAAGSGATAMSSSDVSAIYGSAGYGDAAATVPTTESVVSTVSSSALDSAPSAASSAAAASNAGDASSLLPTAGGASSLLPSAGSLVKGLEGALSNLTNSASAAGTSGEWSLTTGGNTGVVIVAMAIAFLLLRKK